MSISKASGWVAIAKLLRPQGRRGELLAEPLSDLPNIFATGTEVSIATSDLVTPDSYSYRRLQEHFFPTGKNAGRVVIKISGCDTISDAEALSGMQVMIASAALPTLDEDTFFVGDLVGCEFYNRGQRAGTIVDVQFATGPDGRTRLEDAAPLLGIELKPDTEAVMVPFVRAWLELVDIPNRRVMMSLPDGLLDPMEEEK